MTEAAQLFFCSPVGSISLMSCFGQIGETGAPNIGAFARQKNSFPLNRREELSNLLSILQPRVLVLVGDGDRYGVVGDGEWHSLPGLV
jgi:hypothetical protein